MKTATLLLAVSSGFVGLSTAATARTNPLGKVITLLDDLATKITAEGTAEAKAYEEFSEWCKDAATSKGFEIKTATSEKESLEATISKASSDIEASTSKIGDLAGDIAASEAELKNATDIRTGEVADFSAGETELVDVVDTLGRAIALLEREMAKQPAAFAQMQAKAAGKGGITAGILSALDALVNAAAFSSADKSKLATLLQSQQGAGSDADDEDSEMGAPAAAAYESHSNNIIEVLEDLKEKAEEELSGLRKAESTTKHNYEMLKQSLTDQMTADGKDFADEKKEKSASQETKAMAEGDLASTEKTLADAKAALKLAEENCEQAAADHESTVAARAEELKVLSEATALLASTTSGAVEQSYSFLQVVGSSVVSVGSQLRTRSDLANYEIVNLVKKLAKKQHSAALAQLASRISAVMKIGASNGEDPFAKVKDLITGMILKLEGEQYSEATEKAYCDEQMAKTAEKKGELQDTVSSLMAKIDSATAGSTKLKGEVAELQSQLATLAKEQAEMDKMRSDSHAAYAQAKVDLEAGLDGVRQALSMLRDYYAASGDASLVQQPASDVASMMQQPAVPDAFDKASGSGTSIIGFLEVVESDFATDLAKEEMQEADAATAYEKITQQNKISNTVKQQDVKYKTQEAKALDKQNSELSSDKATADSELDAVLDYDEKIKERCIAKPETYESRKGRREAEVQGLKDALSILSGEASLLQHRKKAFLATAKPHSA